MSVEFAPDNEPQTIDRATPPEVLEGLVRGEMEVVTTASGTILYVPQRLDE